MNWCLVFTLALAGLGMGVLSLFGLTWGIEPALWLVIALVAAFVVAKRASSRPFLHGLLVGFHCGIANALVQFAFYPTYLANNPEAAEMASQMPGGLDMRVFLLIVSPVIGTVYGLVLGGLSVLARRIFGPGKGACCA